MASTAGPAPHRRTELVLLLAGPAGAEADRRRCSWHVTPGLPMVSRGTRVGQGLIAEGAARTDTAAYQSLTVVAVHEVAELLAVGNGVRAAKRPSSAPATA